MSSDPAYGAWSTRVLGRRRVGGDTLAIELERPSGFAFRAGQFLRFDGPRG